MTHQPLSSKPWPPITLTSLKQRAQSGAAADVDFIMTELEATRSLSRCKLIDFALSLVKSDEGQARLEHFLFRGTPVQRNYAGLYFKRLGNLKLIEQAVRAGAIDITQAYSR